MLYLYLYQCKFLIILKNKLNFYIVNKNIYKLVFIRHIKNILRSIFYYRIILYREIILSIPSLLK